VDIQRFPRNPNRDAIIKARQHVAGKFGFMLGCVAAIAAVSINLYRSPRPFTFIALALAVLLAALNMPVGIGLGLLAEKLTRSRDLREP
jgi:hypothetical protein